MAVESNFMIDISKLIYNENITNHVINYIIRSQLKGKYFLLKYRNTRVLFSCQGYQKISGFYKKIKIGEYVILVSPLDGDLYDEKGSLIFENIIFNDIFERPQKYRNASQRISLIIPLYGSPYFTKEIGLQLVALQQEINELNIKLFVSVDFHGDARDIIHKNVVEEYFPVGPIVFFQKNNLGFIKNANFLYSKTQKKDLVILLTSDVKISKETISRMIFPLVESKDIALCTPLAINGANLKSSNSELFYWKFLDSILSYTKPEYPDAETNVGYLLGINRARYKCSFLFDEYYENGYGDDSDLYYRCVNLGYRGVVVDNACVFHEGGGSFSLHKNEKFYKDLNFKKFFSRWGSAYINRVESKVQKLDAIRKKHVEYSQALESIFNTPRLLFILPTNNRKIGGVKAIFDICEELCASGIYAAVASFSIESDDENESVKCFSFQNKNILDRVTKTCELIVATSHDTVDSVVYLSKKFNKRRVYFIQGPEQSFEAGNHAEKVLNDYHNFDQIWVVSKFLENLIKNQVSCPVQIIPFGPANYRYYNEGGNRILKSIAVQFSGRLDKGSDYLAAAMPEFYKSGYSIYSFGNEDLRGMRKNYCEQLGFLNYQEKIKLFNSVEFYFDASHFEGLGLLLIESTLCGAIPIYRLNGGSAELLKTANAGIRAGDFGDIPDLCESVERFRSLEDWTAERERCRTAFSEHNLENAVKVIKRIVNALH